MQVVAKDNRHFGVQNVTPEDVKGLIEFAGHQIASVHFVKRSTGELRKMSYRLHVTNPTHAKSPKSVATKFDGKFHRAPDGKFTVAPQKRISARKQVESQNAQMTVFDVNKVVEQDGQKVRGAWRTVPLDQVVRIVAAGITYEIMSYKKV